MENVIHETIEKTTYQSETEGESLLTAITTILNMVEAQRTLAIHEEYNRDVRHLIHITNTPPTAFTPMLEDMQLNIRQANNRVEELRQRYEKYWGTLPSDCSFPAMPTWLPETRQDAISQAEQSSFQGKASTTAEASSAWQEFVAAKYARALLLQKAETATRALRAAEQDYTANKKDIRMLLNAEREMTQARLNLVHAEKAVVQQAYRLLAATGTLSAGRFPAAANTQHAGAE